MYIKATEDYYISKIERQEALIEELYSQIELLKNKLADYGHRMHDDGK